MAKSTRTKKPAKAKTYHRASATRRPTRKGNSTEKNLGAKDVAGEYRARIRMFRQGIGDAFLLSFGAPSNPSHILIDCGVLTGTPDGKGWVQRIAQNVKDTTGGHLNAIVGTHPHWDHLSGFYDAEDIFNKMTIDEVWLSWAENPSDAAAKEHKGQRQLQLDTVRRALKKLATAPDQMLRARGEAIEATLDFHGPEVLTMDGTGGTDAALDRLRRLVRSPCFWEPGDLITRDWLPEIRVYVLGPPRDEKLLSKMIGKKGSEMYGLGSDTGLYAALLAQKYGAIPSESSESWLIEATRPFDSGLCWSAGQARKSDAFAALLRRYEDPKMNWRGIENDWLLSAEQLALQLDNVVNNLSLVLAFEFVKTKEVLLFAADAQIGNWLSWQKLSWRVKDEGGERIVQSKDMLPRTIFYKVGHHGSHNATLMYGGLEDMVHPKLVAAIPVNQDFANKKKKWDMPAKPLYPHLLEKTRGRLLRADGSGATASDSTYSPEDPQVEKAFAQCVIVDNKTPSLYVDYAVP
jgi:hypothetical protein